jgi:hypothetical protein
VYKATVLSVMVASPTDVSQERLIARDVIAEWNAVHANDRKTVLMPLGWETHAMPAMGDRPQAIINGQLLKEADLLIAMFWTRIGSPTGAAVSGTVEEIEEHIGAGRPAMIYFSSAPVLPSSIVPEQYAAVQDFKQSLQRRGLYEEYESLSDFRQKFSRQLAKTIISAFPIRNETLSAESEAASYSLDDQYESLGEWVTKTGQLLALSEFGRELLLEATKDRQGAIMSLTTMDGSHVQTNGKDFVTGGPRSEAQWRGAVSELERLGMIEDRAGKQEVFFVTDKGYQFAERVDQQ